MFDWIGGKREEFVRDGARRRSARLPEPDAE